MSASDLPNCCELSAFCGWLDYWRLENTAIPTDRPKIKRMQFNRCVWLK
jgi:hypothetical protein